MDELRIVEVFDSIQGEGTRAGLPCAFVRLAGCNLHCRYCDTRYACEEPGEPASVAEMAERAGELGRRLVCLTGGEPLLQAAAVELARRLIDRGHTVLMETNGTLDITPLPPEAVRIMDVKCPASGECGKTLPGYLDALNARDEVKFVLCDRGDFDWAAEFTRSRRLIDRCAVLMAPAEGRVSGSELCGGELAAWILDSGLEVRLQLQLHRILWPDRTRGV